MFVFGATVFGEDGEAETVQSVLEAKAQELAEKEAQLMAELDAVRGELEATGPAAESWRSPAAGGGRRGWGGSGGAPSSLMSAPTPGISALDFMPVVTRGAVPAMAVGLDRGDVGPLRDDGEGSDDGTEAVPQGHMLPIFRLPTIDAGARFMRRAPTEKNLLLEQRDRDAVVEQRASMAKLLNMTTEEVMAMELEAAAAKSGDAGDGGAATLSSVANAETKRRGGGRRSGKRSSKRAGGSAARRGGGGPVRLFDRGAPRVLQSESNPTIDELRRALGSSLTSLVGMNARVDQDIIDVQELCPITSIRAQMFMKRRGMGKLTAVIKRVAYHKWQSAFDRWRDVVENEAADERRQAFARLQAANNLNGIMQGMLRAQLVQGFRAWMEATEYSRELEQIALETEAAMRIQTAARGYLGRKRSALQKMLWLSNRETRAASKLQSRFRGHTHRRGQRRETSARKLQRWWRRVRNPEERLLAVMWRKHSLAARKVQAVARRRLAKKEVARRREHVRQVQAARFIQKRTRGSAGRKAYHRKRVRAVKDKAATRMQTKARGMLERKRVEKMRATAALERRKMESAALMVQTRYRAHRGQLAFHLKMQAKRAVQRVEGGAAAKLQARFRGKKARVEVEGVRKSAQKEMVTYARAWAEFFDETENRYFYFNEYTDVTEWEPPADGYRKLDGSLVLWNGKTITDPDADEDDEKEGEDEEADSEEEEGAPAAPYDFNASLGPYDYAAVDSNVPEDGYATGEVSTGYESGYGTAEYGTDAGYGTAASDYDASGYATGDASGVEGGYGDEYAAAYDETAGAALDAWGAVADASAEAYADDGAAGYATEGDGYGGAASAAWTEYYDDGASRTVARDPALSLALVLTRGSPASLPCPPPRSPRSRPRRVASAVLVQQRHGRNVVVRPRWERVRRRGGGRRGGRSRGGGRLGGAVGRRRQRVLVELGDGGDAVLSARQIMQLLLYSARRLSAALRRVAPESRCPSRALTE